MSKDEKANKVIMNSRYNSLYAYDYKTGTAGKVLEGSITDYCIDEVSGNIYYYEYNDGMYCYNVKSKEKIKFLTEAKKPEKWNSLLMENMYMQIIVSGRLKPQEVTRHMTENVSYIQQMASL